MSAARWLDEQLRDYGGVSQRDEVNDRVRVVLDALAAAERELAGVRKVEAWLDSRRGFAFGLVAVDGDGHVVAVEGAMAGTTATTAGSIPALGHALSPEVPDTPREATGRR